MTSTTLFLGDLSIFCKENDLRALFEPFGTIISIHMKGKEQKKNLSYAFIKFESRECAENALREINGQIFKGRALKIGWASNSPNKKKSSNKIRLDRLRQDPTAQLHVSFESHHPSSPVNEETLRAEFEHFGRVVDATIKKTHFQKDTGVQRGYGFVHFELTDEGIRSALQSIQYLNNLRDGPISYQCELSKSLQDFLSTSHYLPTTLSPITPMAPTNFIPPSTLDSLMVPVSSPPQPPAVSFPYHLHK